jgi:hypothetical protein
VRRTELLAAGGLGALLLTGVCWFGGGAATSGQIVEARRIVAVLEAERGLRVECGRAMNVAILSQATWEELHRWRLVVFAISQTCLSQTANGDTELRNEHGAILDTYIDRNVR